MKKRGIAGLITVALLAMFLLPGCVSMDQINTLEQEISSLQNEMSAVAEKNQELESDIEIYVTRQELTDETSNFVTKQDFENVQEVRDSLLNGLSDELQTARGELESLVGSLAKGNDVRQLAERVQNLEEDSSQVYYVITQLMTYGGYSSSTEMMEFAYGLVDIYDSLNDVQVRLQKLKEAMVLFVED
ncbi:MAG: hypothetical protein HQ557_12945 [Bacteroidetes bacterium]|nr:hypothetical protein [Bacteroidota bacterium]